MASIRGGSTVIIELEDVYQYLAGCRAQASVQARAATPEAGLPAGFDVFGYEECARVLREPRTFSSSQAYADNATRVFGRTIIGMDDPEHKRHRDLVADIFQQRALAPFVDEVVTPACHELIDRVAPSGRADLVADLSLLLPAGVETTARSIVSLVRRLLAHPDQLADLIRDRSLMPQAIEEGLRCDAPALMIMRVATRDTELGGMAVPAGSALVINLG